MTFSDFQPLCFSSFLIWGCTAPRSVLSPGAVPQSVLTCSRRDGLSSPMSWALPQETLAPSTSTPQFSPQNANLNMALFSPNPISFLRMAFRSFPKPSRPFPPWVQLTFVALNPRASLGTICVFQPSSVTPGPPWADPPAPSSALFPHTFVTESSTLPCNNLLQIFPSRDVSSEDKGQLPTQLGLQKQPVQ